MTAAKRKEMSATLPAFDLNSFTPYRVAVAAQHLSETLAKHYRERFGITIPEWRVLVHLSHAGGASVRDIENAVVMEKSKVSRTASRLEARNLVTKAANPNDKRLVRLELTAEGVELMSNLLPLAAQFQAELEANLRDTFDAFEATIEQIFKSYGPSSD